MFCLHCGTQNTPDSKFCKECGGRVAEKAPAGAVNTKPKLAPQIAEDLGADEPANPQLQRLLDMAFWHNQTGNVPAGILACEAALIIDPDSTSALSLLGCLYERQGDMQKAIYAFERVVHLNPDSEADYEKLAALQRGEYLRPVPQPLHYRWAPPALVAVLRSNPGVRFAMAGAAACVVFVAGLIVLKSHLPQSPPAVGGQAVATPLNIVPGQGDPAAGQNAQATGVPNMSGVSSRIAQPSGSPAQAEKVTVYPTRAPISEGQAQTTSAVTTQAAMPRASEVERARAAARAIEAARGVPPLSVAATANPSVPFTSTIKPLPSEPPVRISRAGDLPQHTVVVGGEPDGPAPAYRYALPASTDGRGADPGPPDPAPMIKVHVHGAPPSASGASTVPPSPADGAIGSAGTLQMTSRGAQLQGKALSLQQQGSYRAAEQAYKSAIAAYKLQIAAGRSPEEARRGIEACETGLQICQQSE